MMNFWIEYSFQNKTSKRFDRFESTTNQSHQKFDLLNNYRINVYYVVDTFSENTSLTHLPWSTVFKKSYMIYEKFITLRNITSEKGQTIVTSAMNLKCPVACIVGLL